LSTSVPGRAAGQLSPADWECFVRRFAVAVLTVGLTGALAAGCGPGLPAQYYPSGNGTLLNRLGPWATPTFARNFSITGEHFWLYATKRGERPLIGVAGAACQCTVRQSSPVLSSSRRR